MGTESDAIKRHIDNTREQLSGNLQELEAKVRRTTDWRLQFRKRPGIFLAAAFGVGLLASRIGR